MIKDSFDLSGLTVVKDEFISFDLPIEKQIDELCEDMFQAIKINVDKIALDIGWYSNTTESKGEFVVYLIKNDDWDNPLVRISTNDLVVLKHYIKTTITFIKEINY